MIDAVAAVTISNQYRDAPVKFRAPLQVSLEKYRENYSPYISFTDFRFIPEIEYTTRDFSRSYRFQIEGGYKDFAAVQVGKTAKDTADRVNLCPNLLFTSFSDRMNNEIELSYAYEYYLDAQYPENWGQAVVGAKPLLKITDFFKARLYAEYHFEHSRRVQMAPESTVVDIRRDPFLGTIDTIWEIAMEPKRYTVNGSMLRLSPEVTVKTGALLTLGCMVRYKETWYPVIDTPVTDYVAEALRSVGPEIWCAIELRSIDLYPKIGYTWLKTKRYGFYDYDKKQSLQFTVEGDFRIRQRISLFTLVDCELSYYDDQKKPQNNISLSGGVLITF